MDGQVSDDQVEEEEVDTEEDREHSLKKWIGF
jgi:hypothetical protein